MSERRRRTTGDARIVVIGAGLQGLCVALALAHRGIASTVIEQRPAPFGGASNGNEGKIHLGLVYAMDQTMNTGLHMLRGALSFSPLIDRWCGPLPWHDWKSAGFRYALMPDSLMNRHGLHTYYDKLKAELLTVTGPDSLKLSYFGDTPSWLWRDTDTVAGSPLIDGVPTECLDTQEIAIDTGLFSQEFLTRIRADSRITVHCGTRVENVKRQRDSYQLSLRRAGIESELRADVVINCAWTDRNRLDQLAGFACDSQSLSYRVKHRIFVRPPQGTGNLVPTTMVQGPYGDLVPLRNGSVYLSWYPECRTYFGARPPADEVGDPRALADIASRTLEKMSAMFPDLEGARLESCSPCVIVAPAASDVSDPLSQLHTRDESGPKGRDNWWSVDTGKLTLAPLHAETTADLVLRA